MNRAGLLLLLAGCALTAGGGSVSSKAPPPTHVTLLLAADLHGAIEPCGCSENMRGGLSRVAQVVATTRAEGHPTFFIATGNTLFPAATVPEPAVAQQERKARAIAEGLSLMGLATGTSGPLDDARGLEFRRSLKLPEAAPGGTEWLDANGHRVAVISAKTTAEASALASAARTRRAAFVVAILPTSYEGTLPGLADAAGVDLVLASAPRDELSAEQNRLLGLETKLAQVQSKGRSLLRVDLELRGPGSTTWFRGTVERDRDLNSLDERIELTRAQVNDPSQSDEMKALRKNKLEELVARRAALAAEPMTLPATGNVATAVFVPIESSVPKEPRVADVERAYNLDVGRLNLAWAQAHGKDCEAPGAGQAAFIGSAVCAACHPEAMKVWQQTKHPHAYEVLAQEGKQFHLDCIGCHVTGWQQPSGVCRVDHTDGRAEVSCESCHGPGSLHLGQPTKDTVKRGSKEVCVGCHDHENSPHFDFETWLPRIRGPGHGLPKT